jgi:AcrR family transcriptional regulator
METLRQVGLSRSERQRRVLEAAHRLFYARGVHEVGMDELVRETGLAKASVYRLYASKDVLIGAYLDRLAAGILGLIDAEIAARPDDPLGALRAILAAVLADVARPGFRGCPFNNASVEFADPDHPARVAARAYRCSLRARLVELAGRARPERPALGDQLAVLIDGVYTNAAHLGAGGPAASACGLLEELLGDG